MELTYPEVQSVVLVCSVAAHNAPDPTLESRLRRIANKLSSEVNITTPRGVVRRLTIPVELSEEGVRTLIDAASLFNQAVSRGLNGMVITPTFIKIREHIREVIVRLADKVPGVSPDMTPREILDATDNMPASDAVTALRTACTQMVDFERECPTADSLVDYAASLVSALACRTVLTDDALVELTR